MALTIGELAGAAGVNVQTVRYYERLGLLEEPPRAASGYRQYERQTVERIRFVQRAKNLGFTLREVKELLELRVDDPAACRSVESVAAAKLAEVRRKIRELTRMEHVLGELVTSCRTHSPTVECPILQVLEDSEREHVLRSQSGSRSRSGRSFPR